MVATPKCAGCLARHFGKGLLSPLFSWHMFFDSSYTGCTITFFGVSHSEQTSFGTLHDYEVSSSDSTAIQRPKMPDPFLTTMARYPGIPSKESGQRTPSLVRD